MKSEHQVQGKVKRAETLSDGRGTQMPVWITRRRFVLGRGDGWVREHLHSLGLLQCGGNSSNIHPSLRPLSNPWVGDLERLSCTWFSPPPSRGEDQRELGSVCSDPPQGPPPTWGSLPQPRRSCNRMEFNLILGFRLGNPSAPWWKPHSSTLALQAIKMRIWSPSVFCFFFFFFTKLARSYLGKKGVIIGMP